MTRAIAIISCLIATLTLFLAPIQGECCETPEVELEPEIEYCVVASSLPQPQVTAKLPELSLASDIARPHVCVYVKIQKLIFHLPARILNCVFRE